MRVQILQHVPFEGPGYIGQWLNERQAAVKTTCLYAGESLPTVDTIDLLVIMGGPMSVNEEAEYPWLVQEKELVRQMAAQGKPILGICLGAQLIANALGARVYSGPQKEIGWFPVTASSPQANVFPFPATATVFHWHGETFDLPDGAVRLASSPVCQNQAFQIGSNLIGLQFHLETTPETVELMVTNCADELVSGEYIQAADQIITIDQSVYQEVNLLMGQILNYLTTGN